MSVLYFENRGGSSNKWNYSDSSKEGFMTQIQGTVVEVKEVAATKFNSNEIDRWPDGHAKINVCLVIQGQSGKELEWVFSPGSVVKPTPAMQACRTALQAAGYPAVSVAELGGMTVNISTVQPPEGFSYGVGNPRPWTVQIVGAGTVPFRGVTEYEEVPAPPAPAAAPVMQAPPVEQVPVEVYGEDIPF